jgi:hypothetical protein
MEFATSGKSMIMWSSGAIKLTSLPSKKVSPNISQNKFFNETRHEFYFFCSCSLTSVVMSELHVCTVVLILISGNPGKLYGFATEIGVFSIDSLFV